MAIILVITVTLYTLFIGYCVEKDLKLPAYIGIGFMWVWLMIAILNQLS